MTSIPTDITGSPEAPPATALATPAWPSARSAWYAATLLAIGYVFSYVDRQVINIVAPLVKADLALTDVQLSLLLGLSFAIPFALVGLFLGWLADRTVRTRLIVVAMVFWSVMTLLCGMTASFLALFLCRVGVGVGEAAMNPAAVSILSDKFAPEGRPRALAFYNMGTTVGLALAYILIGALIPKNDVTLPLLGSFRPWQIVFVALGIPGILYGLVLLTLKEPVRRGLSAPTATGAAAKGATYSEALSFMWARKGVFVPLFIGMGLLGLLAYGPATQTVLYMTRTFGWTVAKSAGISGLVLVVSAIPGALFGGWLASRLRRQGRPDGTLRAIFLGSLGLTVPMIVAYLMPTPTLFWIFCALQYFFVAASINLGNASIADITPNQFRGKAVALHSLIITLLGLGVGPSLIAMITDYVIGDEQLIRYSLSIFSAIFAPAAVIVLGLTLPAFRRVAIEAQSWTGVR